MSAALLQANLAKDIFVVFGQTFADNPFLDVAGNPEPFLYDLFEIMEGGALGDLERDGAVVRGLVLDVERNSGGRRQRGHDIGGE